MKIWVIADGEAPPIEQKNPSRLFPLQLFSDAAAKAGHKVTYWCSTFHHYKKSFLFNEDKLLHYKENWDFRLLHSLGYPKNISWRRMRHTKKFGDLFLKAAEKEEKPDAIISIVPSIEQTYAAAVFATKHKIPFFVHTVDMWPDSMVEIWPKWFRPIARIVLIRQFQKMHFACSNATGLFSLSDELLAWTLTYADRERSTNDGVFPLSYPEINLSDSELEKANKFWDNIGLKKDDFIVAYVGSLQPNYRLDIAIDAAKKLGNKIKLVIGGCSGREKELKKRAANAENIIFAGWLNKEQVSSLLLKASIGLAPNASKKLWQLHLQNKPIEYFAAGLPVITSLEGVLKNVLEQNKCGFYYPENDSQKLADIINDLIPNQELLKEYSQNSFALYQKEFIAKNVYKKMAEHLCNVVEEKN